MFFTVMSNISSASLMSAWSGMTNFALTRLILAHVSLLFAAAPLNGSPCDQHDAVILNLVRVRGARGNFVISHGNIGQILLPSSRGKISHILLPSSR